MARLNENEMALVRTIIGECKTPADVTSKLKELFAGTLEQMLEVEMEEHLGYEKHSPLGDHTGNSRNGRGKKTIKSEWGEAEIEVPRDRNGTFVPKVIEKRQTRTDDIEARIMAMYAKGMSTREIEEYVRDIYGVDVSPGLVSKITDRIMPEVREWQARPLDDVYPVVFFDGVWFKGRSDGKVVKKCVYSVLGVTVEGKKHLGSLFFNYDLLGYGFMGLSTFFIGFTVIPNNKGDKAFRLLLWIHGIFFVSCLLMPMFPIFTPDMADGEIIGTLVLLVWCAYFLPICVLGWKYFREMNHNT